jgi:MoaA/NifB/PqqE/SkfB family radical SAM enzyme
MNLHRIEFVVTYQCTGKCRHCFVGDKKLRAGASKHADPDKAAEAIEKLTGLFVIDSVMTFGGEPLLFPDTVCAIHAKASEHGVKTRQIITNGYFTKDSRHREDVARRLKSAGVNDLLLSVDAFHQETIPFDAVYAFARELLDAGVPNVRLHPAWVVDENSDNSFNETTRKVLAGFAGLGLPVSTGNNIFMTGNAVSSLSGFYEKPRLDLSETCSAMPYTEPLTNITALSIEPDGDAAICDFVIGNINTEEITGIVSRYDPYGNDCMRALLSGGATALLDYAERRGISVNTESCYSVCDICRKVTGQLQK